MSWQPVKTDSAVDTRMLMHFVFFFVLSLTLFDPLCVDPLWLSMFDSQEKETHDGCHCFCKTCKVTSHVHLIRMGGSIQALKNENT